ncbi:MAG: HAD-IA family hydrolase, partial [Bacteroidota bacterium]
MIKAVVFDMDGVLVNSEPFWSIAEREVFSSLQVELSPELCLQTSRMTTRKVAEFWYARSPWGEAVSIADAERMVIEKVKLLIQTETCEIPGVRQLIHSLKRIGLKIGLATNAPDEFIHIVLSKVGVESYFDATCSSEHEAQGKPAPDVYSSVLNQLGVAGSQALAIEDS